MKFFVVLLAGLCALAAATPTQFYKKVDKDFVEKQKYVLSLFKHVNQECYNKHHSEIAKTYNYYDNIQGYTKPEVVEHFHQLWKYGFIPRGEIFSVFYEEHLEQAIALFKLFYYAKDFETFYKTAIWARNRVNEGVYLYSLSVAVVHRPDTYGIVLPPIYEIYPYYFYNSEVINKAYYYKQVYQGEQSVPEHGYTIYSNYSGHYLNLHPEQSLSYYLEDVGINSFYYYYNLYYPFWLSGEEFNLKNDERGALYYFVHQQLGARYYLERLSHGFGEVEYFDWDVPFETPYYPSLTYANGLPFPERPKFAKLHEYFYNYGQRWTLKNKYGYSYTLVNDFERRIRDAIDSGFVYTHEGKKYQLYTEDGLNLLGNLIEGNTDSPYVQFYGALHYFARHLLGYSYQPLDKYKVAPSALEHFETSLRDPAFYQLYKKIVLYFQRYYSHYPTYTEKDLYFKGVKVQNVEFDRLITYFDYFYSDLTNAVYVTPQEAEQDTFKVRVRQHRLNHKPFTYKVHVKSDVDTKASVKVFLGPKYDEYGRYINISENRLNFVLFDHFVYDLKSGENVVKRSSYDSYFYGPDRTSYSDLYKQVLGAHSGGQEYQFDWRDSYYSFPQRYLLPIGKENGATYQFYVIVYPYVPYKHATEQVTFPPKVGTGNQYVDDYPLGYPFDRFIKYEDFFYNVPNSYFYETKIYHKHVEDINASTFASQ